MIFGFENGCQCSDADKSFVDQICLQMGFKRGDTAYDLTTPMRGVLQLYPELAYFRDIVFMLKLVMVPGTHALLITILLSLLTYTLLIYALLANISMPYLANISMFYVANIFSSYLAVYIPC